MTRKLSSTRPKEESNVKLPGLIFDPSLSMDEPAEGSLLEVIHSLEKMSQESQVQPKKKITRRPK